MAGGRHRLARLACLGIAAAFPLSAGGAQSTFFDPANATAEAESSEGARDLFDALAVAPLDETRPARSSPVRLVVVDEDIAPTFARGERVAGWQARGVDLRAIARARPGGLAVNIAIAESPRHSRHISFRDGPIETWVPHGWRLVARRGRAIEAPNVQIEINRLTPMLMLVERVAYRREGQAWCRVRAQSRFFADPAAAATDRDVGVFIVAFGALAFLDRTHLCVVMEEEAPGLYRARHFDREGYRLPALDAPEQAFQLVPRPPNLYRIVARPPGPAASSGGRPRPTTAQPAPARP